MGNIWTMRWKGRRVKRSYCMVTKTLDTANSEELTVRPGMHTEGFVFTTMKRYGR